ncbi:MAG TPA: glycoside hydrolase family 3 N-terminal domain-containing protein [Terriglobales bacterium]|nr:glycoside hydrolase family 3 N-terminal domain-containing protein [Terriglobales bacterium]
MAHRLLLPLLLCAASLAHAANHTPYLKAGPVNLDSDGRRWAERTLKKMSLEQKIGQMLMVQSQARFMNDDSAEAKRLHDLIRQYHLGGLVLSVPVELGVLNRTLPYEAAMFTNALQRDAELPLMIAADFERGPSMRLQGTTVFPHAMAFGAAYSATNRTDAAEKFGEIVAQESRALGVEWNFFPVADVNSNPANPIINTRSFGEDPHAVSELVAAYIRGSKKFGMLTTAKHFPGHGDTATDTHLALAQVPGDRQRLNTVELPPFEQAIAAGVDAVMVAHVSVPALDPTPNRVATNSPLIVTDLLKHQLGFKGLVITDAVDMNALSGLYVGAGGQARAAVDCVKAGNDIVLQPSDIAGAYRGLIDAVNRGEIPPSRIDESVRKILQMKASVGLNKARFVDVSQVETLVAKPENVAFGQSVSDAAVTLVRDNGQALPLRRSTPRGTNPGGLSYGTGVQAANRVVAVIFVDNVHSDIGRTFERELRARVPDANIFYVDPKSAPSMQNDIIEAARSAQNVIALVGVAPSAGKVVEVNGQLTNSVSLDDATSGLMRALLQDAAPKLAVVALGSPYLAQQFPEVQAYLCTFSNEKVSEISAAKALFGEIPIHGKLPVTIPAVAARGSGIDRDVVPANQNAVARRQ